MLPSTVILPPWESPPINNSPSAVYSAEYIWSVLVPPTATAHTTFPSLLNLTAYASVSPVLVTVIALPDSVWLASKLTVPDICPTKYIPPSFPAKAIWQLPSVSVTSPLRVPTDTIWSTFIVSAFIMK